MHAMRAVFQRISLSTLRTRLLLLVLLALLPVLLFAGYTALGGLTGRPAPAGWFLGFLASAMLGAILAVWAGAQLLVSGGQAARPAPSDEAALSPAVERSALGLLIHDTGESSTELALRATHARLLTAQRIGKIGNWEFDIAANRVWWSDQTYEIYGLARQPSEAAGFPAGTYEGVLSYVYGPDRERFEAAQKELFAGGASLDIEHRIVKASGELRWVHGLGEAMVDAEGKPVMLSGTVQDITERKLAEEALRASEAQFRLLTDTMPQIVCTMRADGWLTYFNKGWLDYTALRMEDSLGRGWTQLVHPEDLRQVSRLWSEGDAAGEAGSSGHSESSEIEFRLRGADGAYRWMLGRAHPLHEEAGHKPKWLGTFTDIQELKHATEMLEKNLAMNRIAGRVAHLGGWTIDLPERTLTWSDENCLIHDTPPGYTPTLEEGIGYFLPEDRPTVINHVETCARDGTPYEFILRKMTAKGRLIWVRSIGEAVRDADGKIIRLQGAFQDISEHKEAENRMLAMEAQLITTLESITDGFFLVDKDWQITYLNGSGERMLRRKREDLQGRNLWHAFPEIADSRINRELHQTVKEQRTTRFEAFYEPLDTWFDIYAYPTEAGLAVYFQDVTQRRQERVQLRLLETAVARLNDIVVIMEVEPAGGPEPRIVFVNDAFERYTGYTREEALGNTPGFVWAPQGQRSEVERIRVAMSKWLPVRAEIAIRTKAGQELWLEVNLAPMADADGKFTHWVAVERDVTGRRQQQQEILELNSDLEARVLLRTAQLATANKELESFAYSVSHDLRSPLNTVDGFSQLLLKLDSENISDKGKHYLNRIGVGVKHMGELIEGLLTLAHLSREQIRSEPVDLSAMARRMEASLREREPWRQAQVCISVQEGLVAQGDPRLLASVLQNLLDNAWKFTARKAPARIDVGSTPGPEGETVYYVKDNGAGFDMAFAGKLFGTFERLHSPGDFPGTGIGLATVKRVIERHGGRVWAESKPDEGAAFYFTVGTKTVSLSV